MRPTIRDRCLDAGLVLNCPGPGMLRLLPPLTLTSEGAGHGLEIIEAALSRVAS